MNAPDTKAPESSSLRRQDRAAPPDQYAGYAPTPGPSADTVRADYLAGYLGSPHTYDAYRADLANFFDYCRTLEVDPLVATRADVAAYLHSLQTAGRSPATVARRLVAIRGFFHLAVLDYGLMTSPADRLRVRRQRSRTRLPALTMVELQAFLRAADTQSPRTAGLAWLLASTGVRISEACTADITGVRDCEHEPWLDVTCKGNLRRSVPLHSATWQRLRPLVDRPSGPIFATRTGAAMDRRAAARTLVRVAAQAGITVPFSPHTLRHTFVTLARATGCALEDVQEAAGHADPATTRAYDRTLQTHQAHPAHRILRALGTVERPARAECRVPSDRGTKGPRLRQ